MSMVEELQGIVAGLLSVGTSHTKHESCHYSSSTTRSCSTSTSSRSSNRRTKSTCLYDFQLFSWQPFTVTRRNAMTLPTFWSASRINCLILPTIWRQHFWSSSVWETGHVQFSRWLKQWKDLQRKQLRNSLTFSLKAWCENLKNRNRWNAADSHQNLVPCNNKMMKQFIFRFKNILHQLEKVMAKESLKIAPRTSSHNLFLKSNQKSPRIWLWK